MSQKVTPLKYPCNGMRQLAKDMDKLLCQDAGLINSKNLSSAEVEIISKISTIVNHLKSLEENFSKARQDLLKKSTLEGRENNKICAVQGKIISNTKKYYKSLEEDITSLSNAFHDQFKKIMKELDSIHTLSKGKPDYKHGSSGENLHVGVAANMFMSAPVRPESRQGASQKIPELSTFRPTQPNLIKTSVTLKEKTLMPYILKSEPAQEVPKKLDFGESQIMNRKIVKIQTFPHAPHRTISKVQDTQVKRNLFAIPKLECDIPIEDSSLEMDVGKGSGPCGENPKMSGQSLNESSREENQDAMLTRRPRSLDSFLTEDRKEISVDNKQNFYI